ncbi:MAG: hypothetical protein AAFX05_00235 [Planctomycetota bacterium]
MSGSVTRRLCTTPLTDLCRGRLSSALDVEVALDDDLPAPLRDLVLRVVGRTRLWRNEKVDVARELASHLQEGLDAGRTSEDLVTSFGDVALASKLIRRAKRRARPPLVRAFVCARNGVLAILGLCLASYLLLSARYAIASPTVAHDYVAELTAPIRAVPEADRAWSVYLEALRAIPPFRIDGVLETPAYAAHGEPGHEAWVAYHATTTDALALARKAAAMPSLGYIPSVEPEPALAAIRRARGDEVAPMGTVTDYDIPTIAIRFAHLPELRRLARHLASDAELAAVEGDGGRVVENIRAILGIATQLREVPSLISELSSMSVASLALDTTMHVMAVAPDALSRAQARDLSHAMAAFAGGSFVLRYDGERIMFDDVLQHVYTDDGAGSGTVADIALLRSLGSGRPSMLLDVATPVLPVVVEDRASARLTYERILASAEAARAQPMWERDLTEHDRLVEQLEASKWRHIVVSTMAPVFRRLIMQPDLFEQQRDATLCAIALELHRRDTVAYPASLDELTPGLLPTVPVDVHTGQPLCYRIENGRPLLYSRGIDRDDDGGTPPAGGVSGAMQWMEPDHLQAQFSSAHGRRLHDGDWILWSPGR